jgi:hypothetical protein
VTKYGYPLANDDMTTCSGVKTSTTDLTTSRIPCPTERKLATTSNSSENANEMEQYWRNETVQSSRDETLYFTITSASTNVHESTTSETEVLASASKKLEQNEIVVANLSQSSN